jgi:DNA-binding CsgD family transcriptional regulator
MTNPVGLGDRVRSRIDCRAVVEWGDDQTRPSIEQLPREASRSLNAFAHRGFGAAIFETVLRQLATAVIVIEGNGEVLFINPSGIRLLQDAHVGWIIGGKLHFTLLSVAELLTRARNRHEYATVLPQRTGRQTPLGITAFALHGDDGQRSDAPVAIFISGEQTAAKPPPALLAEMYALTGGELRVLLALLEGKSPDAIAAGFAISIATVRTHLVRLFEKTESTGQVDLLRKVTAAIPPLDGVDP